jgi:UDP-glucose 4-epimerase
MAFPRIVDALAEDRPFRLFGDGEQSRSFTYVGDVVEATVLAMAHASPGSILNVGGGQEATVNETIALLEEISGKRLEVKREAAVQGDQRRTKADTSRIRSELGWAPRTTLEEGLRAQWIWAGKKWAGVSSPT